MKRLSIKQKSMMALLFGVGISLVLLNWFTIIFLFIGYAFIGMSVMLFVLECGPSFWYWWVPFGFGTEYRMDENIYTKKYDDIEPWLLENFGKSIRYYNYGEIFYFMRKTDAMAFKLMWEK